MVERVAVVGAGAAGLAACWAAAQRGAELRLFDGGVGATCLAGGAVDDQPWEQVARASELLGREATAAPLRDGVGAFASELGLWQLPAAGAALVMLASEAGKLRFARGCDRGLLDLCALPDGARVLLPRVARAEWDADCLSRVLGADPHARARRLSFDAVDVRVVKLVGEDRIAAAELASRHDDPARASWLADRLREALTSSGRADAVLMGPWLGVTASVASRLADELGIAVGEALSGVGGPAGLRFEAARTAMLSRLGVELEERRVEAVVVNDRHVTARLDAVEARAMSPRAKSHEQVEVDAVVLAIGGLVGGGVIYDAPERSAGQDVAAAGRAAFRVSLDAPVTLAAMGKPIDGGGSMHGPALELVAWPTDADPGYLEAVGVAVTSRGRAAERIFVAGDAVADRPRTMLEAVHAGVVAGFAACESASPC